MSQGLCPRSGVLGEMVASRTEHIDGRSVTMNHLQCAQCPIHNNFEAPDGEIMQRECWYSADAMRAAFEVKHGQPLDGSMEVHEARIANAAAATATNPDFAEPAEPVTEEVEAPAESEGTPVTTDEGEGEATN